MNDHFLEELAEQKTAESRALPLLREPRKYKVLLMNDDYTPMEFVVSVLQRFFHMPEESAVQCMLQVHFQGKGICGVFTHEIAETKVALVNDFARTNEHPLLCCMEAE